MRLALMIGVAILVGCSDDATTPSSKSARQPESEDSRARPSAPVAPAKPVEPPVPVVLSPEELVESGRSVYNSNCIACHGIDPTKDGALGPAVSGASLELIEARVLTAEYPEGYAPKRTTRVMIALPHLKPRLAELAAYLDSVKTSDAAN